MPDEARSLRQGAIAPWARSSSPYYLQTLEAITRHYKVGVNTPWSELPKKVRDTILYGSGDEEIRFSYDDGARRYDIKKAFEGVIANMERRYKESDSAWIREELERYQSQSPCEVCHGYRLKPEALCVKIAGRHIGGHRLDSRRLIGRLLEVETGGEGLDIVRPDAEGMAMARGALGV